MDNQFSGAAFAVLQTSRFVVWWAGGRGLAAAVFPPSMTAKRGGLQEG